MDCDAHKVEIDNIKEDISQMRDMLAMSMNGLNETTKELNETIQETRVEVANTGSKTIKWVVGFIFVFLTFLSSISFTLIWQAVENSQNALIAITQLKERTSQNESEINDLKEDFRLFKIDVNNNFNQIRKRLDFYESKRNSKESTKVIKNKKTKRISFTPVVRIFDYINIDLYHKHHWINTKKLV